jgi:hypothetical protein
MVAQNSRVKTDNGSQAHTAKVAIRKNVLSAIDDARVFDAFAGSGEMFSAVWKNAAFYTGCDQKPQKGDRLMFCADNRRVLRAIDLAPFNVFDFDSYGSPWEQAIILAARRSTKPAEMLGLILTEGTGLFFRNNGIPIAIAELTGLRRIGMAGVAKNQDWIINKSIEALARRMNCDVVKRWQAEGRTGAAMRYIGLVLRGRQC